MLLGWQERLQLGLGWRHYSPRLHTPYVSHRASQLKFVQRTADKTARPDGFLRRLFHVKAL